jgi:CMP-N-acetylneuraminic acid synthetase
MSIIVIGNGPSVFKNKFGGFIDSFDEVVRINHYKPNREFVGEKLTHFYSSSFNKFFYKKVPLLASSINIIFNYIQRLTNEFTYDKFPNTRIEGIDYFEELKEYGFDKLDYTRPSSGIFTLLHLIKTNKYKEIVIYGFDNLVVGEQLHYFEKKIYPITETAHNSTLEKTFIEINIARGKLKRLETFVSESLLTIPKILCIIPARSGSKGLPNKNISLYNGKPLMAWSIEQATQCLIPMRVICSTDSLDYSIIANQYGAETPFLRPSEISDDLSTDIEFITHSLNYLKDNESYYPEIIVQLRPTFPSREVYDIEKALLLFLKNFDKYDSLRSVVENTKSPYKMYRIINNNLEPLISSCDGKNEPYNLCRQELPTTFLHNGCIDILKVSILEKKTISGKKIYPYLMTNDNDIDTIEDFNELLIKKCIKRNCTFTKHSDIKNNGGLYCCLYCKENRGSHGPLCRG